MKEINIQQDSNNKIFLTKFAGFHLLHFTSLIEIG